MRKYAIAIHGGAGPRIKEMDTPEKEQEYRLALQRALESGSRVLAGGGSSLDAVEHSVNALEDCSLFNAGKGSVYTAEGTHELDASIMDGKTRDAGAVAQLRGIKNPVSLARSVMEQSEHVFLAADGAMRFAQQLGYEMLAPEYFAVAARYEQWLAAQNEQPDGVTAVKPAEQKLGTVGAVACDSAGNLAAATSTGGILNKRFGRVGDSPIIGSGNYANNKTCAISCTGSGEFFIRGVVAYDVACLIEHKGLSLQAAAEEVIHKRILEINGDGGLIAVDAKGNIAMPFNTRMMLRACVTSDSALEVYI
jgi:beta-aspartyl-peptidase (threonine type)